MGQTAGKKIGLLDHMGAGNLGDETTQTAVMENLRKRWPGCQIYGFSMNPPDTNARHGIPSYPIRRKTWDHPGQAVDVGTAEGGSPKAAKGNRTAARMLHIINVAAVKLPTTIVLELIFLGRSYAVVRTIDIFIISGGGQLLDSWGGPWAYPFTIFKWVVLARLAGAKCYLLNLGAGPLKHPLSKFFIRHALRLAEYVSLRDPKSEALVREIGFAGDARVCPDLVYGLSIPPLSAGRIEERNDPIIGMSPMAYCDPRRYWLQDHAAYQAYVGKFAAFGSWLSQHHRLVLFSTDIWFDRETLEDLRSALQAEADMVESRLLDHEAIISLETLLHQMSRMDYIITCRFHGVIFAHLMNIPVLAISHHSKVATLMADLGLSDYCLDIDTFDQQQLIATFDRMVKEKDDIKVKMADKAALYKSELVRQFDELFCPEAA